MGTHNLRQRSPFRALAFHAVTLGRRPIAAPLFLAVVGVAVMAALALVFVQVGA